MLRHGIRRQADTALAEFLQEIKNAPVLLEASPVNVHALIIGCLLT